MMSVSGLKNATGQVLRDGSGVPHALVSTPEVRQLNKTVRILGTRGVPANYGGFETAAENVAGYLARKGWRVIVYCQADGKGPVVEDRWNGIERVTIPVDVEGWRGSALFDWLSIAHACKHRDMCLTFGYNTGIFNFRQRLLGIPNVVNMDGIEWSRKRWGKIRQAILYAGERFAAVFSNHMIADHPEIEKYLWSRAPAKKITMIAYGADVVLDPNADLIEKYGVVPGEYFTLIARPIPENTILEIVRAYSRKPRGKKLLLLGGYTDADSYHVAVRAAASDEVIFPGGIYDKVTVQAIRAFACGYFHGHTVGGTNPSLVEAMAAGNPVIAHDNAYNRWVVGDGALYFDDEASAAEAIDRLTEDAELRSRLGKASLQRFIDHFTWDKVASEYERLLLRYV